MASLHLARKREKRKKKDRKQRKKEEKARQAKEEQEKQKEKERLAKIQQQKDQERQAQQAQPSASGGGAVAEPLKKTALGNVGTPAKPTETGSLVKKVTYADVLFKNNEGEEKPTEELNEEAKAMICFFCLLC